MALSRPLLVHPGAIGDLIRLTGVARALTRRWRAPCDLVTRHRAAPEVFAGLDSVASIRHWPSRSRPYGLAPVQWRLVDWLRQRPVGPVYLIEERIHPVVPWRSETRMEWLLRRAGIPDDRRVVAHDHPRGPFEPFVAYGLRLAALDPAAVAAPSAPSAQRAGPRVDPMPELAVSAAEFAECRRWLAQRDLLDRPLVVVQTASRRADRGRWPRPRWCELIGRLLAHTPQARILLLGSARESRQTGALAAACADPRVVDLAGEVPLRRLFALLSLSDSCISLDTGPAHAAAAVACPLVVLAGRADPRRNLPTGADARVRLVTAWPRHRWPDSPLRWYAEHDVAQIEVSAVFAAWESLSSALEPSAHEGRRLAEAT